MRLIDADKIKQSVTNEMLKAELNSPVYCTLECVIADIDNQPTAYDVDKVVDQLEENAKYFQSEADELAQAGDFGTATELQGKAAAYRDAVKAVKSGGIE